MGKRSYDPALRKTEHGSKLYETWKRVRTQLHCEEWGHFPTFYEWALQSGYETGAWLRLDNNDGLYCPENCVWYYPGEDEDSEHVPAAWADTWNKTVNRIRKYYGMPPLEGTEYGD